MIRGERAARRDALPRPERDALLALPLHVLVRDYPETLPVLRARGVALRGAGGWTLARIEAEREDGEALLSALLDALEWRPAP